MDKTKKINPPLCACGCREKVRWNKRTQKWNTYIHGHSCRTKLFWDLLEGSPPSLSQAPLCACGCKGKVNRDKWTLKWNKYVNGHSCKGIKRTKEFYEMVKRSNAKRGCPDATRKKIAIGNTGKKVSKETRKKLSISGLGKKIGKDNPAWKGGLTSDKKYQKTRRKEYQKVNKEKIKDNAKAYYKANKKRITAYKKTNKVKINLQSRKRRQANPKLRINSNMSRAVWYSLKKNKENQHWELLVGYSVGELITHLEKQFKPGMTWNNYGEWHIDHIVPVSVFNFTKSDHEDFQRCWALKNLQPLWAEENLFKRAKINKHFQPSLLL